MKYAVVKNKLGQKEFTKLHEELWQATNEASRLASQELCSFMVLKVLGYMEPSKTTVWREEE